ncbi:hypothetical protein E1163_13510 [Fulvivirga kasyanovii]|uniref:HmuY protein n=2 Tax=Fulvivirga kasyanovii TaxID=396812 RepID=A0ABW9RRP9_9BACT|nr:hypothetical protein [Fulvivirga kasyanovii]
MINKMNMIKLRLNKLLFMGITALLFAACSDDDESSSTPVAINFTNTEASISSANTSSEVSLTFSRPASSDGTLALVLTEGGSLTYGSENDYYTTPEMSDGVLELPFSAGDERVTFSVSAGASLNIEQDITITFELRAPTDALIEVGSNSTLSVTFSENFVATGGTIELNGGGEEFPNQAFIDLGKLTQSTVDKYTWDLGFYTKAGEFYVILNSSATVMARPLDKNDLTAVTAEDTLGFGAEMRVPQYDPSVGAASWIDATDGDLANTAIGEVSSQDSDNKVFIIKRDGDQRNWKKIRVLRNGDNYTLQYADITSTDFSTIEVAKDDNYNFSFIDLDNGAASVEPVKTQWDIMYGYYSVRYSTGGPAIPYGFKDYIIINRNGVSVAMVMNNETSFEEFSTSHVAGLEFNTAINAMGSEWRDGGGPGSAPSLFEDRYFVIADTEGNVFKLKFNRLASTTGERGYPEFTFELVK